jgi:hypothetical protein
VLISQEAVLGENGLIAQLKKRVVERAFAGELTHHLGYAKGEAPEEIDNHRNGYSKKTVIGEDGAMLWRVPSCRRSLPHLARQWHIHTEHFFAINRKTPRSPIRCWRNFRISKIEVAIPAFITTTDGQPLSRHFGK